MDRSRVRSVTDCNRPTSRDEAYLIRIALGRQVKALQTNDESWSPGFSRLRPELRRCRLRLLGNVRFGADGVRFRLVQIAKRSIRFFQGTGTLLGVVLAKVQQLRSLWDNMG